MKSSWNGRVLAVLVVAGAFTLGLWMPGVATSTAPAALAAQAQTGGGQSEVDLSVRDNIDPKRGPVDLGLTDPALIGAIDIHAHLEPTVSRRMEEGGLSIDYVDYAKLAKSRGLRGFVQKSHSDMSSASNAYMARTHVTPDLEIFGRMTMNLATGGINVASVVHFANIKGGWGRVIEMPTWDAEYRYRREKYETEEVRPWIPFMPPGSTKYVSISRNGELLPEVKALIAAMAKIRTADSNGRLALATGHSSGEEDLLLAREARKLGLQVTAPHGDGDMTPEQLQEYAKLGAFIEMKNGAGTTKSAPGAAELVRKIGADSIIVSSDCGFMNYPLHTDCLALVAQGLRSNGITERQLDIMFKENPAKFLGLPLRRTAAPSTSTSRP